MDSLPSHFFEQIAQSTNSLGTLTSYKTLSGPLGPIANEHLDHDVAHGLVIRNGQIAALEVVPFHRDGLPMDVGKVRKKYLRRSEIYILDDPQPQDLPEEDSSRDWTLPDVIMNTSAHLVFKSSDISKETESLIRSIKCISFLTIEAPITDRMQKIIEIVVRKRTLNDIYFKCGHPLDRSTTQMLWELMQQRQFWKAVLRKNCVLSPPQVVAGWKPNRSSMIGKFLIMEMSFECQPNQSGSNSHSELFLVKRIKRRTVFGRIAFGPPSLIEICFD